MRIVFTLALLLNLALSGQLSMASVKKQPIKIDLGLVEKNASTDLPFKPETDPSKRSIDQERYTALNMLEWQNSDALGTQKTVTEAHSQYQQQIRLNQALQNLPSITIRTPATYK
jgi:hypothetical protein